jgi:hypothetical protein
LSTLNTMLLLVIADLNRRGADATVLIKSPESERTLHVAQGHLIGADSNVQSERLGDMLASEGRLNPDLVEPAAIAAARKGKLLGDQLIAIGMLSPLDVWNALERQVLFRFANAVSMSGSVSVAPKQPVKGVVRRPLGAAVVGLFRERLKIAPINQFLTDRPRNQVKLDISTSGFSRLELVPAELRVCRRLADGENLGQLLDGADAPENVLRIAAALVALGLWA